MESTPQKSTMNVKNSETNEAQFEQRGISVDDGLITEKPPRSNKAPQVSIIIPTYNEANSITNVLSRIPDHSTYEIIVVNDGSTDDTLERIKSLNHESVKVINHKLNIGYGAAILTGLKYIKGDIIITLDSDGQHRPEEIPALIKPVINGKADLVVGSRYLGNCRYRVPLSTKVGERMIGLCLWLLFTQKVRNNQSGFRVFNRKVLELLKPMKYHGMAFSTEVLFKIAYHDLKILERPISLDSRMYGTSYVKLIKILLSISSCILYYFLKKFRLYDIYKYGKSKRI